MQVCTAQHAPSLIIIVSVYFSYIIMYLIGDDIPDVGTSNESSSSVSSGEVCAC